MSVPVFQGIDVTYKNGADNKDIRDLLESLIPKAKAQMKEFAKSFKGRTEQETCKNIFDYIKSNFAYVADGGEQVIKLPSALLKYKVGDCKSYSLFTISVLENLKIPYEIVYTSYSSDPVPSHVYVRTEKCIIDVVYGQFNREKKPTFKYVKKMNVKYIAGISGCGYGCNCSSCSQRIGSCGYTKGMSGPKPLRKIALAPGRGLFLGIVALNLDGIASKLQKVNQAQLKQTWENVGGNFEKLKDAIRKGASKPAKRLGLLGIIKKKLKDRGVNGIGATDEQIKGAIIAAATAIGTAIAPAAGSAAGASIGAVLAELYPVVRNLVNMTPDAEMTDVAVTNVVAPIQDSEPVAPEPQTGSKIDVSKVLPFVGVAVAIYYYANKK